MPVIDILNVLFFTFSSLNAIALRHHGKFLLAYCALVLASQWPIWSVAIGDYDYAFECISGDLTECAVEMIFAQIGLFFYAINVMLVILTIAAN